MVCSPRKFLKMHALTSLLRPVLGLNMVHIGSDKQTDMYYIHYEGI